jgi:hypothetical protein
MAFGGRPWSALAFNATCSDKPGVVATFTQFNRVVPEVNTTEQDIRRRRTTRYFRQARTSRHVHTVQTRRPEVTTTGQHILERDSAGSRECW